MQRLKSIVIRASVAFVLLFAVLNFSPLVPAIARWETGEWDQPKGDVLIVLGADELGDGTLGIDSYWRSVYTERAFLAGGFQRILISGGKLGYPQSVSVARAMEEFIVALGVPSDRIILEERSRSTHENALFSAAILRNLPGRKVLLTSDCHMRRARRAFEKAGVDVIPAPIPFIGKRWNTWIDRWACSWTVGLELLKTAYYDMRGWT